MPERTSSTNQFGPFTEAGRLIFAVAQREATTRSGTKPILRAIHLLVAVARTEKTPASQVLARLGVTAEQLDRFLSSNGEPRDGEGGRARFTPRSVALFRNCEALMNRWGTHCIDSFVICGTLAESGDPEIVEAFRACGTSGAAVMEALQDEMRTRGILKV